MFFSIIIPMYNIEKYIEESIQSVLLQTFSDFELILIDDGSFDLTLTKAKKYFKKDARIRLFEVNHGWQAKARNVGIEKSKGDYITFLDGDDYWGIEYLQQLKEILDNNPCDICVANNHINFSNNEKYKVTLFQITDDMTSITLNKAKKIIFGANNLLPGATWLSTYNKEFLSKYNIKFNESYSCSEDLDFFIQSVDKAKNIKFFGKEFYYYRQDNAQSTIRTMSGEKLLHRMQVYKKWYDYYALKEENKNINEIILDKLSNQYYLLISMFDELDKNDIFRKVIWKNFNDTNYILNRKNHFFYSFSIFYFVHFIMIKYFKNLWIYLHELKRKIKSFRKSNVFF